MKSINIKIFLEKDIQNHLKYSSYFCNFMKLQRFQHLYSYTVMNSKSNYKSIRTAAITSIFVACGINILLIHQGYVISLSDIVCKSREQYVKVFTFWNIVSNADIEIMKIFVTIFEKILIFLKKMCLMTELQREIKKCSPPSLPSLTLLLASVARAGPYEARRQGSSSQCPTLVSGTQTLELFSTASPKPWAERWQDTNCHPYVLPVFETVALCSTLQHWP